ncbi:MAG: post-transcriptional regulator [Paenibacillus sp.]|jgi:hypothetical protein|nr:post-transcriptional regulator [Paenibacillus sp.]
MDHDGRKTDTSAAENTGLDSERRQREDVVLPETGYREDEPTVIPAAEAGDPVIETGKEAVPDSVLVSEFDEAALSENGFQEEAAEEELSELELNEVIESICTSKAEEFRMLGYEHVTGREVWECISDKYHKTGVPPLHKVVNDILSLKVTQFMNWMTMSIYKSNPFK